MKQNWLQKLLQKMGIKKPLLPLPPPPRFTRVPTMVRPSNPTVTKVSPRIDTGHDTPAMSPIYVSSNPSDDIAAMAMMAMTAVAISSNTESPRPDPIVSGGGGDFGGGGATGSWADTSSDSGSADSSSYDSSSDSSSYDSSSSD